MRWTDHVAHIARTEIHTEFWWRTLKEGDQMGNVVVDEMIILKWTLSK
jgi:hypothetical protein